MRSPYITEKEWNFGILITTHDGREIDALSEAPDGVGDGEGEDEEETAKEEDIRDSSSHGVDSTGWAHHIPTVSCTLILRDALLT